MHMRSEDGVPIRPLLPPAALAAAAMVCSCAYVIDGGWIAYLEGAASLVDVRRLACVAVLSCLFAAAAWRLPSIGPAISFAPSAPILRFMAAGCALAALASTVWLVRMDASRSARAHLSMPLSIAVSSDAAKSATGWSASGVVNDAPEGAVRLRITSSDELARGSALRLYGSLGELPDNAWGRSRFMRGEVGVVSVRHSTVERIDAPLLDSLRSTLLAAIEPQRDDARALCAGIVCGSTTYLSGSEASEVFSVCGLSHLVAVSGGHLVLISSLLQRMLIVMRLRRPLRISLLAIVCCSYAAFTGCAPSAVRSAAMVLASSAASVGGRRPHGISGLAIAVICMAAADPACVFDMGFQLSALSVLFLGLYSGYVRWHLLSAGLPEGLSEALSCTLCAQWATIPITLPVFGELSLVAPLANLIVAPVMNGVLAVGIAAFPLAALVPVFHGAGCLAVALARIAVFAAELLSRVPAACIGVEAGSLIALPLYGAAAVIYLRWRFARGSRVRAGALVCAALMMMWGILWTRFAPPQVVVMDVGQADAILIRDGSSSVLVDAGVDERCARALARNNVYELDAVVITHWDRDHCGGLDTLLRTVSVERLVVAEGAASSMPADIERAYRGPVVELRRGDALSCGRYVATALWPLMPVSGEENADSIVLALEYRGGAAGYRMLLCGDAEAPQTNQVIEVAGDIDVLKLGHHGSRDSVDDALLEALDPEMAIASAGEDNPYGHPDDECMATLRRHGVEILCTASSGDIMVAPDTAGPRVSWRRWAR